MQFSAIVYRSSQDMAKTPELNARTPVRENLLISRIIPLAILAPSAHNTQPWQFAARENTLEVYVDWSRHLAVSDPTKRQLYISIGCAITNVRIAATRWGYTTELTYFPEGDDEQKPVARITMIVNHAPSLTEHASSLFAAIKQRHTDRSLYDSKPLREQERAALVSRENPAVLFVEDRDHIAAIARLTEEATKATLSRKDFKEELSHWVRNSWTRQPDGMPGFAMGMPAPVSLFAPLMVRVTPIHKQEAPKTRKQIESASAVAVIVTPTDTPADWLRSGEVLELVWLEAVSADLAAAPLAAAIEAQENIRARLAQVLGSALHPQGILRIGHSAQRDLRATPRRSSNDCLRL